MKYKYPGPKLTLHYTNADRLSVLHHISLFEGCSISVVGDADNGAYEWLINDHGNIKHSDCSYGESTVALRDGLIEMHGLPQTANA